MKKWIQLPKHAEQTPAVERRLAGSFQRMEILLSTRPTSSHTRWSSRSIPNQPHDHSHIHRSKSLGSQPATFSLQRCRRRRPILLPRALLGLLSLPLLTWFGFSLTSTTMDASLRPKAAHSRAAAGSLSHEDRMEFAGSLRSQSSLISPQQPRPGNPWLATQIPAHHEKDPPRRADHRKKPTMNSYLSTTENAHAAGFWFERYPSSE